MTAMSGDFCPTDRRSATRCGRRLLLLRDRVRAVRSGDEQSGLSAGDLEEASSVERVLAVVVLHRAEMRRSAATAWPLAEWERADGTSVERGSTEEDQASHHCHGRQATTAYRASRRS